MRPGEERLDGPPIHGNTRLEIIWTAIPTVIIAVLCAYATVLLLDIQEAPAKGTRVVNVTGEQFAWTFAMNEGGKRIQATRIVLPVDEPVEFRVRSKDVHPRLLGARVAAEGRRGARHHDQVLAHADRDRPLPGRLRRALRPRPRLHAPVHLGRQRRRLPGVARRRQRAAAPAPGGGGGGGADGAKLFADGNQQTGATACGACHTLSAAGTNSSTGPNLDETVKGWDAARISEAITDPAKEIAQGFGAGIMPPNYDQTLSPEELDALVKYIDESVNR